MEKNTLNKKSLKDILTYIFKWSTPFIAVMLLAISASFLLQTFAVDLAPSELFYLKGIFSVTGMMIGAITTVIKLKNSNFKAEIFALTASFFLIFSSVLPDETKLEVAHQKKMLDQIREDIERLKRLQYSPGDPIIIAVADRLENTIEGDFTKGAALFARGKFGEAIEAFERNINEDNPEYVSETLYFLAISYAESGNIDGAELVFSRLLAKFPSYKALVDNYKEKGFISFSNEKIVLHNKYNKVLDEEQTTTETNFFSVTKKRQKENTEKVIETELSPNSPLEKSDSSNVSRELLVDFIGVGILNRENRGKTPVQPYKQSDSAYIRPYRAVLLLTSDYFTSKVVGEGKTSDITHYINSWLIIYDKKTNEIKSLMPISVDSYDIANHSSEINNVIDKLLPNSVKILSDKAKKEIDDFSEKRKYGCNIGIRHSIQKATVQTIFEQSRTTTKSSLEAFLTDETSELIYRIKSVFVIPDFLINKPLTLTFNNYMEDTITVKRPKFTLLFRNLQLIMADREKGQTPLIGARTKITLLPFENSIGAVFDHYFHTALASSTSIKKSKSITLKEEGYDAVHHLLEHFIKAIPDKFRSENFTGGLPSIEQKNNLEIAFSECSL